MTIKLSRRAVLRGWARASVCRYWMLCVLRYMVLSHSLSRSGHRWATTTHDLLLCSQWREHLGMDA